MIFLSLPLEIFVKIISLLNPKTRSLFRLANRECYEKLLEFEVETVFYYIPTSSRLKFYLNNSDRIKTASFSHISFDFIFFTDKISRLYLNKCIGTINVNNILSNLIELSIIDTNIVQLQMENVRSDLKLYFSYSHAKKRQQDLINFRPNHLYNDICYHGILAF